MAAGFISFDKPEEKVSDNWTVPTIKQIERMKKEDFPDPGAMGVMVAEAVMFGGMTYEERSEEIKRIRADMGEYLRSGDDVKGTIRIGEGGIREICWKSGSPGKWTMIEED